MQRATFVDADTLSLPISLRQPSDSDVVTDSAISSSNSVVSSTDNNITVLSVSSQEPQTSSSSLKRKHESLEPQPQQQQQQHLSQWDVYMMQAVSIMSQDICDKHAYGGIWVPEFDNTMAYLCQLTLADILQPSSSSTTTTTMSNTEDDFSSSKRMKHMMYEDNSTNIPVTA